jgi:hypothetical protein
MAGLTNYASKTALDLLLPTTGGTSYLAYSVNGTSEFAGMARTAVGATGWAAATSADPSVKANANILTSAAATGAGTITSYAVFDAPTAGNQLTDWTSLAANKTVAAGDQLTWAVGAAQVTLT